MLQTYDVEVIEHAHWLAVISVALHLINGATVWRWQKSATCISFWTFQSFFLKIKTDVGPPSTSYSMPCCKNRRCYLRQIHYCVALS